MKDALQQAWDAAPELAKRWADGEAAAKAENAALRKDAERYRKLRAGNYSIKLARSILNDTPHGIDAAVDALPDD